VKGCRPLTDAEVQAVLESLGTGKNALRDRALFTLGLRTGLRISELLSLRLKDVYQNGNLIDRVSVSRRHMKRKLEGRTLVLHAEARAALEAWARVHPEPEGYLFRSGPGRVLHRRSAYKLLKLAYSKCGLQGKLGTHSMRKTLAKRVYEKSGKNLVITQRILGQKSVNSTISYLSFEESEVDELFKNS